MSASKFTKKLKKELLRNPKKSAILAFGLAAAVYFWIPLVGKWMGWGEKVVAKPGPAAATPASPKVVAPSGMPTLPELAALAAAKSPQAVRWDELLQALKNDELASPGKLSATGQNPFAKLAQVDQDKEKEIPEKTI